MAYGDLKDLTRRTVSYKALRHEVFNIAKNLKYDGYPMDLTLMVYKFFDKKTSGGAIKNEIMSNKELAEELQKSITAKFKKRKVYLSFINNIQGADLAAMQLIKDLDFDYVFLVFLVNTHGLFL